MADSEKLLLYGGLAVAAYFVYEYYISPATAASSLPVGVPATGIPTGFVASSGQAGSSTAPHAGDTWINAENQVVAQYNGTAWVPMVETATNTTGAVSVTPAVPVTPAAAALSLATIYAKLLAAVSTGTDPAISGATAGAVGSSPTATPDVFNYYLAEIIGTAAPDPIAVFGGRPQMTIQTYWSSMAPYLTKTMGLSGLVSFGLGCLKQQYQRAYIQNGQMVLR